MSALFRVVRADTGEEPDLEQIVLREQWAKGLMHCDMEGWAVEWDGTLILCDECGAMRYPPPNEYRIEWLRNPLAEMERDSEQSKASGL